MQDIATGIVFDIQRFCTHDGPGIRTVVFLKGCPLYCPWCHNPESQSPSPELRFNRRLCIFCGKCVETCPRGAHQLGDDSHALDRDACERCLRCAAACPTGALEAAGRQYSAAQIMEEVEKDRVFYEESGGGLTLSGGEPMSQFTFACDLLGLARRAGLHTCLETCGAAPSDRWREIAPLVDLFLWDLKHTDESQHLELTGAPLSAILENLRQVDTAGGATRLRCILLKGINLHRDHLDAIARVFRSLRHCQGIDLLPFHPFGQAKTEALGRTSRRQDEWIVQDHHAHEAADYLRDAFAIPAEVI